jgi:hypothetical protein
MLGCGRGRPEERQGSPLGSRGYAARGGSQSRSVASYGYVQMSRAPSRVTQPSSGHFIRSPDLPAPAATAGS